MKIDSRYHISYLLILYHDTKSAIIWTESNDHTCVKISIRFIDQSSWRDILMFDLSKSFIVNDFSMSPVFLIRKNLTASSKYSRIFISSIRLYFPFFGELMNTSNHVYPSSLPDYLFVLSDIIRNFVEHIINCLSQMF